MQAEVATGIVKDLKRSDFLKRNPVLRPFQKFVQILT